MVRSEAFRSVVRCRLGPRLGLGSIWNRRTQLPTLASLELSRLRRLGAERGLDVAEACQADWRPVIREPASDPLRVPSVARADSVADYNRHPRPMERARGTRAKYRTHRLSVLTWAVWKGVSPREGRLTADAHRGVRGVPTWVAKLPGWGHRHAHLL